MPLNHMRSLGRSGLVVSPLALGTMTFGTARWGSGEDDSREIFNTYVEAGGNFIDTADVYASGRSEEMVGTFVAERGLRDQLILATKAGFAAGSGAHTGGNGAKHLYSALSGSLKRLRTDYIDLYWIHVWDGVTPAEELLETMAALVRSGRIRYWGISNTPAWYVSKIATLAVCRGLPGPIALQYFYSLANREIEDEHLPLAAEFGMGVQPWSPLAYGLLTGKYDRATVEASQPRAGGLPRDADGGNEARNSDDKRLDGANPFGDTLFTEKNWAIVETLKRVAREAGETPATIALAWVLSRRGVTSTLMGVSRPQQITDNARALEISLVLTHQLELNKVSTQEARLIYGLSLPTLRKNVVFGGIAVSGWRD